MAAYAEKSVILMAKGESGYTTLFNHNRVPSRPQVTLNNWLEVLAQIETLIQNPEDIKLVALDALGGYERLCHEYVCDTHFDGDWGKGGFLAYQNGFDIAISEWLKLLAALERLRFGSTAIDVLFLGHAKVQPFKNPMGADFDRYACDCHHKTWGVTHHWADAVLFGMFPNVVVTAKPDDKKGKGIGGTQRVLYTERRDAFDAKNRFGLPKEIDIPNNRTKAWSTLAELLKGVDANAPV